MDDSSWYYADVSDYIIIFNRRYNIVLGKIDHMDFTVGDLGKAEEYLTEKLGF